MQSYGAASRMRRVIRWFALSLSATLILSRAEAAELGQAFDTYLDMHANTDYGALLFRDPAASHRFILVKGEGELTLPGQTSYCFVLNHYSREKGFENRLHTYRAKTSKWYAEAEPKLEPTFRGRYIPTADISSEAVTDYCIRNIAGVRKVAVEFGSDDGSSFGHNISFALK